MQLLALLIIFFAAALFFFLGFFVAKTKKAKAPQDTLERPPAPAPPPNPSYRVAFEALSRLTEGVCVIDAQTNTIAFINSSGERMLGVKPQDTSFRSLINALPPTFDLQKMLKEAVSSQKPSDEIEIAMGDKTLAVMVIPISKASLALIMRDVTFEASLEKVKQDFIHMMIHEMRAPLTAIKGAAQLLDKSGKKQQEKMTTIIQEQSKKLLDQVSSLLDLAKIEASRFAIQKTPTDIKKLIQQAIDVFNPQATSKGIVLTSNLNKALPQNVSLDPIRITQVLNNFISNSIKFTPKGGSITVAASISKTPPRQCTVSVADTGIGIPKEKQQEIFSKFYQVGQKVDDNPNNHIPGTGLGLYIARQIIEAHKGTIDLVSQEGKGTTISFSIPA